jgi:hypothetical protein
MRRPVAGKENEGQKTAMRRAVRKHLKLDFLWYHRSITKTENKINVQDGKPADTELTSIYAVLFWWSVFFIFATFQSQPPPITRVVPKGGLKNMKKTKNAHQGKSFKINTPELLFSCLFISSTPLIVVLNAPALLASFNR